MHTLSAPVFADVAPVPAKAPVLLAILGGVVCFGVVFVVALVAYFLLRGGKKTAEPGSGLLEDLSAYPPPPQKSQRQLTVQGRPSRVRLVVMAPVGKRDLREFGEPEDLLNRVVHGLGDVAREDRPRIRTWPPQLSKQGFAPSFFRNTSQPGGAEGPRWTLLAGPAKAGDLQILLGIAVWSEETSYSPQQSLEPSQWVTLLRVEP